MAAEVAPVSTGAYNICKWMTFWSMYVGYTLAVFNRKCFSFAMPAIMQSLHLDKDQLGLISSSQNLAYTLSKFCGGVLSDRVSAKILFTVGLFFSGIFTVSLTAFQTATPFAVFMFLQGLVQGGGWPACAKILKQWFSPAEFGMWYSILNTTMNLACSIGPILTAFITAMISWQASMTIYGLTSLVVSVLCFFCIWNSPTDIGHPSCTDVANKPDAKGKGRGRGRGTWQDMIRSPFMWVVCTCYLVLFMGRTATLDWAQLYLIQELGQSPYIGSLFISSLEVGGIIGSILAGYIADRLVATSQRDDVQGTPRMTVATVYVVIYISGLHALTFLVSGGSSQLLIMGVGFVMGFGIYGPVSLYGVMAIEAAPTHLSGTSHAIVSLASNIGAILAGLPFSYVAKQLEWKGSFMLLEVLLIGVLVLKILTRNLEYKMVPTKKKLQ
jgi:MFS transporter, OPA family, solute carrier family 37 (glycerol-6-phosphate transporter), member 4